MRDFFKEDEYCIKPEYYEHYKKLYLSPESLSAIDCWIQTLKSPHISHSFQSSSPDVSISMLDKFLLLESQDLKLASLLTCRLHFFLTEY